MRNFLKHLRPVRLPLTLGLILALLNAFTDLFMPTVMAWIVDQGIVPKDKERLLFYLGVMLAVSVFAAGVKYAKNVCAITSGNGYAKEMRSRLFEKGLLLSEEDLRGFGAASMITRCTNDVQQVADTIDAFVRMMVRIPITCLGGLILAFMQDARIALIILSVVPVICILSGFMIARSEPLFKTVQGGLDRFNKHLREQLSGIRVVRAFNREKDEEEKLYSAGETIKEATTTVERLLGLLNPLMTLLVNITIMGMVLYAVLKADSGMVSLGALLACIQYASQILMAIVQSSMLFSRVPRAMVSARRMEEVLQKVPSVQDDTVDESIQFDNTQPLLRFRHVCYRFTGADEDVLHDLNFTVQEGQTVALIGATGCGKSTILSLVERFAECTAGEILLYGVNIRSLPQKVLRAQLGYVPQQSYLFSGSLEDNLKVGSDDVTDSSMQDTLDTAQATEFVSDWSDGLEHTFAAGGTNVSGGQRQRLSIARALIRKPALYLFDDSFSALDFATDAKLRHDLKAQMGSSSLLLVAQRVGTVLDADSIIVLERGRIAGMGTHKELMQSCPVYQEIVSSQLDTDALKTMGGETL